MSQSTVIAKLIKKFKPEFLGLENTDELQKRLLEYGIEKKVVIDGLVEASRDAAFEAWTKYRVYDDAYDYWLTAPESATVQGEGDVSNGNKKEMLARIDARAKTALGEWETIAQPTAAVQTSSSDTYTTSVAVEVVW